MWLPPGSYFKLPFLFSLTLSQMSLKGKPLIWCTEGCIIFKQAREWLSTALIFLNPSLTV
jgi:hypothetical protein